MFIAILIYVLLFVTVVLAAYQVKFCFEMFDEPFYRIVGVLYSIFILAAVCFFIYIIPCVFNFK